jgi:hypothetical protein
MPSEERATRGAVEHRDTALRAVVLTFASLAAWWCWSGEASADDGTPAAPSDPAPSDTHTESESVDVADPAEAFNGVGPPVSVPVQVVLSPAGTGEPVPAPVEVAGVPVVAPAVPVTGAPATMSAAPRPPVSADEYIRSMTYLLQPLAERLARRLGPLSPITTPLLDNALDPVRPALGVVLPVVDQTPVPILDPVLRPVLGGAAPVVQQVQAASDTSPPPAPSPPTPPPVPHEDPPAPPPAPHEDPPGTPGVASAGPTSGSVLPASAPGSGVGPSCRPVAGPLSAETRPPNVLGALPFGVDLRPVPRRTSPPAPPRGLRSESVTGSLTSLRREVATDRVMNAVGATLHEVMTVDTATRSPATLPFSAAPAGPGAALPDGLPTSGPSASVMARTADAGPPLHRVLAVANSSARSAQAWSAWLGSSTSTAPRALDGGRPPVTPD